MKPARRPPRLFRGFTEDEQAWQSFDGEDNAGRLDRLDCTGNTTPSAVLQENP
jgi:hypothetical protein